MSGLSPTEEKFEEHIEKHLFSIGYTSTHFHDYDRSLCMIKDQVIDFIKTTQPEKWERLTEWIMEKVSETDLQTKFVLTKE